MGEKYDQQDGAPNPRPDTDTARTDKGGATVGERETQGNMAGQGLGQMSGDDERKRADDSAENSGE